VRRALVTAVLAILVGLSVGGGTARAATSECRGLMVCVPVAGPWVVVPSGADVPRQRVEFQLECPRGYVAGGLDAELTDRMIDVGFLATLGSPVNPGISTSRAVVFVATYVGAGARGVSFRPHIGCIPASGGGGVRIRTSVSSIFRPGRPTVRRVRTVSVVPGRSRVVQGCGARERLISGAHAIAFRTSSPPSPQLASAVHAKRTVQAGRAVVAVQATNAVREAGAIIQVGAVCAGRG
jgi:hypothetical protein